MGTSAAEFGVKNLEANPIWSLSRRAGIAFRLNFSEFAHLWWVQRINPRGIRDGHDSGAEQKQISESGYIFRIRIRNRI